MSKATLYLLIYIFLVSAIAAIGWLVFYLNKRQKIAKFLKSLEFVLYEITLPYEKLEERPGVEKKAKELIVLMEHFYDGLAAIKSYFALEIGIPFTGNELVFYAAVEKEYSSMFEKHVQGQFPQASMAIKQRDYNIFKPSGFSAGSYATLKREAYLPIKTYDKFESDPLQTVINVFSKLKKEGEGAALQLIICPTEKGGFSKKMGQVLKEARKGKSFRQAVKSQASFGTEVLRTVDKEFLGGVVTMPSVPGKEPKPPNEQLLNLLEIKASHVPAAVNFRLVVSAESQPRADAILRELESAFVQFNQVNGNNFEFERPSGKKLKNLFYEFSFRIPDVSKSIVLNTTELATIFHFPSGIMPTAAPQLKYVKTKEAPPPLNLPLEGILLGRNIYRGAINEVHMNQEDRRRHVYVIGQTGTGKSNLLKNMMIQDIEAGRGVCFIDPHGSDLQDILTRIPPERADDVIYFNPGDIERPLGLNMLEYDQRYPEQKIFIVNELLGIFNKLFDMKLAGGPMFEQYFRNSALLVMDSPSLGNTLVEIQRVLADADFRRRKLEICANPIVKSFWKEVAEKTGGEHALQNMVPWITSKFDNFLSNDIMRPIISQEKSAFNFRDVMDSQKILLVNLSKGRLGDINSSLLGLIIVGKLLMASLSRVDIPENERKDFYLYIDEFQNVTTDSISTILSEARKYKLNLNIAHQFIGQLSDDIKKAVFGNVGSIAAFRVGVEDGEFLAKQFEPVFNSYDLINIDNYNAYVKLLIGGQVARPFSMQSFPFQKGDSALGADIAKLSSLKFGRLREQVEAETAARYGR